MGLLWRLYCANMGLYRDNGKEDGISDFKPDSKQCRRRHWMSCSMRLWEPNNVILKRLDLIYAKFHKQGDPMTVPGQKFHPLSHSL